MRQDNKNFNKTFQKKNYETLKPSFVRSKTRLSIPKLDSNKRIPSQHILMKFDQKLEKTQNRTLKRNQSNKKIISSFQKTNDRQKLNLFKNDFHETQTQFLKHVRVEKSKISSKKNGCVCAYAANSHPGPYNMINEDRICIVTNLSKNKFKTPQIQFFAIYDGHNGSNIADYMRDKFHNLLIEDSSFFSNVTNAIKNTIRRIQKEYLNSKLQSRNDSSVSFVMLLIIDQVGYSVQVGQPRLVISRCLGKELSRLVQKEQGQKGMFHKGINSNLFRGINLNDNRISSKSNNWNGMDINIRLVEFDQNSDFILMGSSGVFESLKDAEILKQIWRWILNSDTSNIHEMVGQAGNKLIDLVFHTQSTQNISIIILAFRSIQDLLRQDQKIQLPYIQKVI